VLAMENAACPLLRSAAREDLEEKAGRRRRFGEEGGVAVLGSGGAPFHSSLSPAVLGCGDAAALGRREVAALEGRRKVCCTEGG
jgi:hypothetical protein